MWFIISVLSLLVGLALSFAVAYKMHDRFE